MNRNIIFVFLVLSSLIVGAQRNPMGAFKYLVGSSWVSEGMQLGGFEGETVHEMELGLDGKIVKVRTFTTDPNTGELGIRNEGIRTYNAKTDRLEFYEFDKFGGITTGTIRTQGKNIHFEYTYDGLAVRESWIYKTENEYHFILGTWEDGEWSKKFYETIFKKIPTKKNPD
jgi:hypothetical protein